MKKYLGIGLLAATLASSAAFAQNAPADHTNRDRNQAATSSHSAGQWRASKLSGVDVYNDRNEKIGDVSDVILDSSGKASKVVVGVGGFLGMGEHYVALDFDKVKWVNEPRSTTTSAKSATTSSDNRAATNVDSNTRTASDGAARTTGTASDRRVSNEWYPDHAVYNASKDQLKSMPEFKY